MDQPKSGRPCEASEATFMPAIDLETRTPWRQRRATKMSQRQKYFRLPLSRLTPHFANQHGPTHPPFSVTRWFPTKKKPSPSASQRRSAHRVPGPQKRCGPRRSSFAAFATVGETQDGMNGGVFPMFSLWGLKRSEMCFPFWVMVVCDCCFVWIE